MYYIYYVAKFKRHPSHVISTDRNIFLPPYSFMTLVAGQDKSGIALLCGSQFPGSQSRPRCQRGFGVPRRHLAAGTRSYTPPPAERTNGLGAPEMCRAAVAFLSARTPADAPELTTVLSWPPLRRPKTTFPDAGWCKSRFSAWIRRGEKKGYDKDTEVLPSSAAVHAR